MEDWSAVADDVDAALLEVGSPSLMIRSGEAGGTPSNPTRGQDTSFECILADVGHKTMFKDGTLVRDTMRTFLVSSNVLAEVLDRFEFDNKLYTVRSVERTSPAGIVVSQKARCTWTPIP